jgi:hypothetical protein
MKLLKKYLGGIVSVVENWCVIWWGGKMKLQRCMRCQLCEWNRHRIKSTRTSTNYLEMSSPFTFLSVDVHFHHLGRKGGELWGCKVAGRRRSLLRARSPGLSFLLEAVELGSRSSCVKAMGPGPASSLRPRGPDPRPHFLWAGKKIDLVLSLALLSDVFLFILDLSFSHL